MIRYHWWLYFFLLSLVGSGAIVAQANDERLLEQTYGDSRYITIATGEQQLVHRAPAIATIITQEDIVARGISSLDDALEAVPGLHVTYSPAYLNPIYQVRGLNALLNRQVLVLLDGLPIKQYYLGDQGRVGRAFPLGAVERIEVIRGPGSALHGADAFTGVVNIVTKSPKEVRSQIKVKAGSFDRKALTGSFPFQVGGLLAAVSFGYDEADSSGQKVDIDQQTLWDQLTGTQASLAPGEVNTSMKTLDLNFNFEVNDWQFRSSYLDRYDAGVGVGVSGSLDPEGMSSAKRYAIQVSRQFFSEDHLWQGVLKISNAGFSESSRLFLLPEGALIRNGNGDEIFYENGMYAEPSFKEQHLSSSFNLNYAGWSGHKLMLGVGAEYGKLFDPVESRNYDNNFIPIAQLTKFDGEDAFIRARKRTNRYVFLQDEWVVARDWVLTSGIRFDDYSDFDTTINPRLALVWQVDYDFSMKALYGRAYRAPSFGELYLQNNPVFFGNETLDPEEMEMVELGFNFLRLPFYELALNVFYYETDELIRESEGESSAENLNGSSGRGIEMEGSYYFGSKLTLEGNYAYQDSSVDDTAETVGGAPTHQVYLRTDWKLNSNLNLNVDLNWISSRSLIIKNPRFNAPVGKDRLDAYTSVNLNLDYKYSARYQAGFSVRNLLDEERFEPTDLSQLLTNHVPLAGRSFEVSFSANF